ncbi:DUF1460 domain-containing protein [Algoriphagus sp. AGSA1]|uniref:N-acetylmuramoyl-L-alanine amidase-like domain-containing protein n=1 Tax=Algoriphagus sp. AGSA1 TaxID=2907213 RepID=UPI001F2AB4B2|nr:N-acetylmuramoyl-L-alanine amidase-like domain-containing protein [Algoriphagus sp. AGSA1]MCE7057553.1 DUF1460 domain-containing protein [Algoriphagus sp. AGSA1]
MNKLFILGILLVHCLISQAQTVCTAESRERLESFLSRLAESELTSETYSEQVSEIGQWFLETPYVEKTLELPGSEKLVINLQGLDCTTFVETVITLTRLSSLLDFTFDGFERELEHLRYRDGKNEGYPSRLHYFSDWIYENQEKGIITDITQQIGGSPYPNAPTFMSENPKFYTQLSAPENLKAIKITENQLQKRDYFFIPKTEISRLEKNIKSGDIIAVTTSMPNLDIVHTGLALEKNGRIHLLHASSKSMKVEISEKPLSEYLAANKSQSGIMVTRLTGK